MCRLFWRQALWKHYEGISYSFHARLGTLEKYQGLLHRENKMSITETLRELITHSPIDYASCNYRVYTIHGWLLGIRWQRILWIQSIYTYIPRSFLYMAYELYVQNFQAEKRAEADHELWRTRCSARWLLLRSGSVKTGPLGDLNCLITIVGLPQEAQWATVKMKLINCK